MKKAVIIISILVIAILTIGFTTNPSYEDYKAWFKSEVVNEMEEDSTQFEKSFYGFFADLISDAAVVREDHKLYSLYTIDTEEVQLKVLGMFNNFYVLEDNVENSTGINTQGSN